MGQVTDRFAELPEDEVNRLEALTRAIEVFREVDSAFPASYMAAFLMVAIKPGLGTSEYARRLGMLQPVASRILLEIGQKARTGEPGLGWIDGVSDLQDMRTKRMFVTPKGRAVLRKLNTALGKSLRD